MLLFLGLRQSAEMKAREVVAAAVAAAAVAAAVAVVAAKRKESQLPEMVDRADG